MLNLKLVPNRLLLASLALLAAHCSSSGGDTDSHVGTGGSANDGAPMVRDAGAPEWRDGEIDAGPNRSPLCGVIGCFPGNLSACGPAMSTEAGQYGGEPARDAGADANARADATAALDAAREAARSDGGAVVDARFRDAVSESAPANDVAVIARADASGAPADPSDASAADSARDDASADASGFSADAARSADGASSVDVSVSVSAIDAQATVDVSADAGDAPPDLADPRTVTDAAAPPPAPDPGAMSCHIRPASTGVVTSCEPFGASGDGDACNDSTDCEAALACVDVNNKTVCRPLRCALPIACPPGTFYREAPLRADGVTRTDLLVPVCVPDDHCEVLAATNPCPAGEVCTVVGTAGETSCVVPGRAGPGDACDDANRCGDGLVCTKHKNTCVKLCHIGMAKDECMGGACEGGNNSLPDNIGVCVGEVTATE
jgi:hypothetical protein